MLTIKTLNDVVWVFLILIVNIFCTLATVSNVDFEQLNVRWVVNETCHTETTTDIFLIIKIEYSLGIFSFK